MMPSQRRMRGFGLLVCLVIVITVYMTSGASQTRTSRFYTRTQEALQSREYEQATKQRDADDVGARLKAAEKAAKVKADKKSQVFLDSVDGGASDKSVAGRVKLSQQGGDNKRVQGVATVGGGARQHHPAKSESETLEEHEVEVELNAILKKSPIIIFSKSYCPHSKKAKHILLDLYKIVPEPFVVELDQHPLGPKLQNTLAESTGRRTVPNVLIIGKSIGGGDDIQELHMSGKIIDKITTLAGSRVTEATRRESPPEMRPRRI
ncbi:thioredoxin-like protein [Massariosphaeria phaeospora]|uniref:Thioredoxin-like protein n=1 Tax=Massariosphaeria phaeospora TaxID=100035 RepID=A0A7C8M2U9_9PLEO|nr:thioredoxin-like protein [Massariosphaeria phaeospora]